MMSASWDPDKEGSSLGTEDSAEIGVVESSSDYDLGERPRSSRKTCRSWERASEKQAWKKTTRRLSLGVGRSLLQGGQRISKKASLQERFFEVLWWVRGGVITGLPRSMQEHMLAVFKSFCRLREAHTVLAGDTRIDTSRTS